MDGDLGFFGIPNQLKELKNSLKILCSESFTSVSAPIQYAAIEAYKGDHSDYLNRVKKILSFTVGNYVYENLKSNVVISQSLKVVFTYFQNLQMPNFLHLQKCVRIF